jgi:outer membrane protein
MRYAGAIAAIGLVALVAIPAGALGTEPAAIGVVDMQRVIEESKYRAELDRSLDELREKKQTEWNERKKAFDDRLAEAKKEMLLLTDEAKAAKNAELAAEARSLQEFERDAQREITDKGRAYLKAIEEKVTKIVEGLAAERNLDLVLSSATVIYKKNVQDLTDAVLEKLDAMYDEEHAEKGAAEGE